MAAQFFGETATERMVRAFMAECEGPMKLDREFQWTRGGKPSQVWFAEYKQVRHRSTVVDELWWSYRVIERDTVIPDDVLDFMKRLQEHARFVRDIGKIAANWGRSFAVQRAVSTHENLFRYVVWKFLMGLPVPADGAPRKLVTGDESDARAICIGPITTFFD